MSQIPIRAINHKHITSHVKTLIKTLTTYHVIASEHTCSEHTSVTTEWPYTPRQTAFYYHMMFIRMVLPQHILASLPLPQPGSAKSPYHNRWCNIFDFSFKMPKCCNVHTRSSTSQTTGTAAETENGLPDKNPPQSLKKPNFLATYILPKRLPISSHGRLFSPLRPHLSIIRL